MNGDDSRVGHHLLMRLQFRNSLRGGQSGKLEGQELHFVRLQDARHFISIPQPGMNSPHWQAFVPGGLHPAGDHVHLEFGLALEIEKPINPLSEIGAVCALDSNPQQHSHLFAEGLPQIMWMQHD